MAKSKNLCNVMLSVKSYLLKIAEREQGPYSETQIAQMFADGRVNRHTPCKLSGASEWRTVDDYLPMLKYGTQLPEPSAGHRSTVNPTPVSPVSSAQRVAVVDFDIPFGSVLKIMFKWGAAAFVVICCFMPVIVVIWAVVMGVFAALIGSAISHSHHP